MDKNNLLAAVGVLLIPFGIALHYVLQRYEVSIPQPPVPEDNSIRRGTDLYIFNPIPDCIVKVETSGKRTLTINESFTVTVHVSNDATEQCKTKINVFAPDFEVQPPSWDFALPPDPAKKPHDFKFALMSKNPGSQMVVVSYPIAGGGEEQEVLGYSVRANAYLPEWLSPFSGIFVAFFGPILTLPWWIERRDKKREEKTKRSKNVADQKKFGLLMEGGQRLYNEIADLKGEDLEAWDTRLTEWQTSVHAALENIDLPADYQEFTRATDEIDSVAIVGNVKNLKWKQENRRRRLQKQQKKLEEIVQRRLR